MANRFSNTKHVHFTHSNSKFCLNSYESDIPMFSLIIIQRHPKTYKTLLMVRFSCVHAFHASEASRTSEIFPCLPFVFLYSYLQFCLSSFLALYQISGALHHFLPSGLLKVSGVAIPGRTRQVPGRHAVLLLPWSMASKTGRVMLKIGRVCEHGSKWKRMKDLRGYQSQMHKRHTAKECCVRRCLVIVHTKDAPRARSSSCPSSLVTWLHASQTHAPTSCYCYALFMKILKSFGLRAPPW